MPENNPNPLEWQFKTRVKLDYFVLSVAVALLGWTLVNLEWLPDGQFYIWLITSFWASIAASIVCGIIMQLYSAKAYGVNYLSLNASEKAAVIEVGLIEGGPIVSQQTHKNIEPKELKETASKYRDAEKTLTENHKLYARRERQFGDLQKLFLVLGLFILICTRVLALQA